jgi:hypothetical protein
MHPTDDSTHATMERRRTPQPSAPQLGELLVESSWRPADRPRTSEGWLIAHGYAPERRER